jgi:beta-glucanase (GH16 family)
MALLLLSKPLTSFSPASGAFLSAACIRLLACLALCIPIAPGAKAAGWALVFDDEFDGTKLDRTKWSTRFAYANETLDHLAPNGEEQRYRDNGNHDVEGGVLSLVARPTPGTDHKYESGLIRSFATFYYGYFEARVKQPAARGTWPAFWLTPDQDATGEFFWPPEIDIFDNADNGKDDDSSTIHSGVVPVEGSPQSGEYIRHAEGFNTRRHSFRISGSLADRYHVYGLLWGPRTVTVFLDGKELYSRRYTWINTRGERPGPAHILLNLAVGGPWAGRYGVDGGAFPQALEIDYVRVCRLDKSAAVLNRSCGPSEFTPSPELALATFPGDEAADLNRTKIESADVKLHPAPAGRTVSIRCGLVGGDDSRIPLNAFVYLVGPDHQVLQVRELPLPIASTEWSGKKFELVSDVTVPSNANKGVYEVYLAIGQTENWDEEGRQALKAITLAYSAGFARKARAAQPTRYLIGAISVD